MPAYRARAEFRRASRDAPWILAGVVIREEFWPAQPGVEPIRGRLPQAGLLGWTALDAPIVAPNRATAAATALELARTTWPDRTRRPIPFPRGVPEP